jgi:hypothetical protein
VGDTPIFGEPAMELQVVTSGVALERLDVIETLTSIGKTPDGAVVSHRA